MERNGQSYFFHQDGLGSIIAITDTSGQKVQSYDYDSFGNPTQTTNFRNSYLFTAREYDEETGLYYYRARYYDPKVGRFISKDPIGFNGGDVNLYRYVSNNPVNATDPSGLYAAVMWRGIVWVLPRIGVVIPLITPKDECEKDKNERCRKEIEDCSELCARSQADFNRPHVYGGSMSQCMKNCLPEECGGEPKWKGYK